MPQTLIAQKPDFSKKEEGIAKLAIAEMFSDTLQGEGINIGTISTFIRLQGCTLQCTWCDTLDVWPWGNEYTFDEIFALMDINNLPGRLKSGQHLILTGGSPLKQQEQLTFFLEDFINRYGFKPYIEVENETVLIPNTTLSRLVDCWNNSPKLENSGMKERARYKPEVIEYTAKLPNSWFKFVVSSDKDWEEIDEFFLRPNLIRKDQIILMPEGDTQEKLNEKRELVADIAIKNQVRFSDRLHVTIWNKKTGV